MSLAYLAKLRSLGLRPSGNVWVTLTASAKVDFDSWSEDLPLKVALSADQWDLRAFSGLSVVLFIEDWTSDAAKVVDNLQNYTDWLTVVSPNWGEDIGFHIHQGNNLPI